MLGDLAGTLAEVIPDYDMRIQLMKESFNNTNKANDVLRPAASFENNSDAGSHKTLTEDVIGAVRSKTASSLLLTMQEQYIEGKYRHGVLTSLEYERVIEVIHRRRSRLFLHTVKFVHPQPEEILRWSRLFAHVPEDTMLAAYRICKRIKLQEDDVILERGVRPAGLYVVVAGYAKFVHNPTKGSKPSTKVGHFACVDFCFLFCLS